MMEDNTGQPSTINLSKQQIQTQNKIHGRETKKRTRREGVMKKVVFEEQKDYFNEVYKENKKKMFVNLFIRKLKQVVVQEGSQEKIDQNLGKFQINRRVFRPAVIPFSLDVMISMLIILQVASLFIFSTIVLAFSEVNHGETLIFLPLVCLIIQLIEMGSKALLKSSLKVETHWDNCKNIEDILFYYLRNEFKFDIIYLIILIADISGLFTKVPYLRLVYLLKAPKVFNRIDLLEIVLIQNCYNEEYWKLVKVFLFNYTFAHIVCVLLILMAKLNPQNNWIKSNNLAALPWGERYIWAYYWATNIILTVGFGDIHAVTSLEAGCMILLEMMSCIILTYNINTVGNIIRKITSYDEEKDQNIKIFNRMMQKTDISNELKKKVTTFINQSAEMRRKYNIEEEEKLISELPTTIVEEFRKEANISIFSEIPFFRHLSHKFLLELAFKVERKLTHPEEIIINFKKVPDIIIANGGAISLHANSLGYRIHGKKMQTIPIEKKKYKLLSFNFLFHKEMKYDIKCDDYCVIYKLTSEDLRAAIQTNAYNYQYYCMMKDKDQYDTYAFETLTCDFCENKETHTVFQCPKLHYIPLSQHIIQKSNNRKKSKISFNQKNIRKNMKRKIFRPLLQYYDDEENSAEEQWCNANVVSDQESEEDKNITRFAERNRKKTVTSKKMFPTLTPNNIRRKSRDSSMTKLAKELKDEISKVQMRMNNKSFFQWDIECDQAFDFKYYFTQYNPNELNKRKQLTPQRSFGKKVMKKTDNFDKLKLKNN